MLLIKTHLGISYYYFIVEVYSLLSPLECNQVLCTTHSETSRLAHLINGLIPILSSSLHTERCTKINHVQWYEWWDISKSTHTPHLLIYTNIQWCIFHFETEKNFKWIMNDSYFNRIQISWIIHKLHLYIYKVYKSVSKKKRLCTYYRMTHCLCMCLL